MEGRWAQLGVVFFLLLSIIMTGCFLWQYKIPKKEPCSVASQDTAELNQICPRFPEPVLLEHPLPVLKEALEKVDMLLRHKIHMSTLPAMSAIVVYNDTVLWTGNFGKRNASDQFSPPPTEYTIYRIASLSKIFPTIMLYKLWEEGKVSSLDDPLEKYARNFSIKNPLGRVKENEHKYMTDGLIFLERGEVPVRLSSVTLRRMASQLSGLPRRLRSTTLLWKGNTQNALGLLKDDVLVADPGTRCHYSNLAFSLLAHVLADYAAEGDYQHWISDNILDRLGMEETWFDIAPSRHSQLAAGFYNTGKPAPLYDLGWYRPSGQMYSTAADLAKLSMALLGSYHRRVLEADTLKTMMTPVFQCTQDYFANKTGTPWEINEQHSYDIIRKDGDLDGYSATFSLVPRLKLGFTVLMSGARPQEDVVAKVYNYLIPAMETAFREAGKVLSAAPSPAAYVGYYTYANLTFYKITVSSMGILSMQQFGPHIENLVPERHRTIKLHYLEDRIFQVVFEKEYPCVLRFSTTSISLEAQDGQLFNFHPFDQKGKSPAFDAPGLNTYNVFRIPQKPVFST
ncbi:putative beta-lactamase-like 1 [Latimeria chalumnae]|uniref:putative beta-lactamase-like 1 n=1 Tax=Latimeria chalumnae TaxID=7897 RepID=UPI0006D93665|nr:PREDICTED: putative beta-lactamase-like 1 [Latimeria chalumnae]|eukprot:XP_014353639.1 PREDICTED: putative beta-lactamase-like 1 [Latimeria chalumnae]